MPTYLETLEKKFKSIKIELVSFDTGSTDNSMCMYILCSKLSKSSIEDERAKRSTVLDLGNYIYRKYALVYRPVPEYAGKDCPKNSLRFFVDKCDLERMSHIKELIYAHVGKPVMKVPGYLPWEFSRLTIQEP